MDSLGQCGRRMKEQNHHRIPQFTEIMICAQSQRKRFRSRPLAYNQGHRCRDTCRSAPLWDGIIQLPSFI